MNAAATNEAVLDRPAEAAEDSAKRRQIVEGARQIFLARGCIYVTANRVVVVGYRRPHGAGFTVPPSVLVAQVSASDGRGLTPGRFTPLPVGTALPPGCA